MPTSPSDASFSPTSVHTEDIDLLDLLIVVAEHLKLLIIAPLLIGVASLLVSLGLPKSYESTSILNAEKAGLAISPNVIVSLITSADFLNNVALDQGIAKDASKAARLKEISQRVVASIGRQDKLLTLRTQGPSPDQAQKLNAALWTHLQPLTLPRGGEMQRLQVLLKAEQARLTEGNQLEQTVAQQLQKGQVSDQLTRLYGELLTANSSRMRAIATLQSQMEGLTTEDLMQTPTLPEVALKPKPVLIAVIATLASGLLLLLFVLARHALRNSSQQPEQAKKIARLRAVFRKAR